MAETLKGIVYSFSQMSVSVLNTFILFEGVPLKPPITYNLLLTNAPLVCLDSGISESSIQVSVSVL